MDLPTADVALDAVIADILDQLTTTWGDYNPDDLPEPYSRAVKWLERAGLVEVRGQLMLTRDGAPEALLVGLETTGGCDVDHVMQALERHLPTGWLDEGTKKTRGGKIRLNWGDDYQIRLTPIGKGVRADGLFMGTRPSATILPPHPAKIRVRNSILTTLAEIAAAERELPPAPDEAKRKPRRRNRAPAKQQELTDKQIEVVQIVGECHGNYAEAGRRLGRDPKTIRQHYKSALKKMGQSVIKHATQSLPTGKRGEVNVSSDRRLQ